jgi:hypothetical protein
MFARTRTTCVLMELGYCVCIGIDRHYFQASLFLLVATLHTLSRFEMQRPDRISSGGLPRVIQLAILSMGLAIVIYLALKKP